MIVIVCLVVYLIYKSIQGTETFLPLDDSYASQKISYTLKPDIHMNFLGDLNDSFKHHLDDAAKGKNYAIKQKVLCDDHVKMDVQNKALDDAFSKVQSDGKQVFDSSIFYDSGSIDFTDNSKSKCLYQAYSLSQFTNPLLYLSETKFPARWIGPYKNIPFPKHTNLKQWSDMYNCCKKNV